MHSETFSTRSEAIRRERYYKTGRGRDALRKLLVSGRRGDRSQVQILSPRFCRFVRAKFLLSILLASVVPSTNTIIGQVMTDSGLQSNPTPRSAPSPSLTAEPAIPERAQIDEIFKQTSLGKEADERRLHLEWRELANRVVDDPDVIAAKRAADTARTDLEKRQRLRSYYDLYYGRMRQMASSAEMKTALDQLKLAHVGRTSQPRVRPAEDGAIPTPSPTPKKKGKGGRLRKFQSKE